MCTSSTRSITKNKQGTMHCAGSNHDLATTTAARAHQLHHTGKNSCCHTPETVPYLNSLGRGLSNSQRLFVIASLIIASHRHLYFTTRGLVDTFCRAFFVELHVLVFLRWTTAVSPVGRSWFSECSTDEVPIVLEHNAHFCVGTAATPREVSVLQYLLHTRSIFILPTSQNRHSSLQEKRNRN